MDLRELLGDKYSEDVSIGEIERALKGLKVNDYKTQFDKASSELAEWKRKAKEMFTPEQVEEMAKAEAAKITKEQSERFQEVESELRKMKQRDMYLNSGFDLETAGNLADAIESGDMNKFTEIHTSYMNAKIESIKKQEREDSFKKTPAYGAKLEAQNPNDALKNTANNILERINELKYGGTEESYKASFDHYFGGRK